MNSAAKLNWIPIAPLRDTKAVIYLILLAAFPLVDYHFGVGNQVEQFAIIARMIDPAFAAGDFYIDNAVGFGPRFYYSKFMTVFVAATSIPVAVFVMSVVFNLATGVVTFVSARRFLNAGVLAGAAAATLAVTNSGFALGLAGFVRFDSFQPASIAIPISLAGLYFAFSGRSMTAAPVFAVASLFHPLIGVEIGLIGFGAFFLATVFSWKMSKELMRELVRQTGAGLIFIILVIAAWGVPSLMSAAEKIPDKEFFDILIAFRSPHHYFALGFPRTHYFSFLLFCLSTGALIIHYARIFGLKPASQSLIIAAAAVLVLCAASVILVDIYESRIYATAQVFRLLFLVKWVGYIFIGWIAARWATDHGPLGLLLAALIMIGVAEAQPRTLAFVLSLGWLSTLNIFTERPILKWALAVIALAGAAFFHKTVGSGAEAMRASAAAGVFFVVFKSPLNQRTALISASVMTALLIAFISVNRTEHWIDKRALTPQYNWADISGQDVDIARWVRINTPKGAVWATPPDFESFRMIAERGIIVDYTSIPFGDLALRAWKERVTTLYGPIESSGFWALNNMKRNYAASKGDDLRAVMIEYGADYAVLYSETLWDGPILYQNETYKAVQRYKSDQH